MQNNTKNLIIEIIVEDDIEAYDIISRLSFKHNIVNIKQGDRDENFNKDNSPLNFLRKNKKTFRDIKTERAKQKV